MSHPGKLLEMFSEIASSHVTYFWFITCSVSLPVVLLLKYVFVVVLFHGINLHIIFFRMIVSTMNNVTTSNLTEHFSDITQGDVWSTHSHPCQ